ncbi:hypothetical protein IGI04_006277 [Brassica rapa subsp. trilocularis]|uniref:Uncharacterized protein n=1 Tax=Brassica rapa subsp. trilocularis TaxID=1813537 RepID=A0ABQ7NI11_BRACM|nr:hypothetical protein IGI04_006009 [Brassica rapa subsp. trilocularis]KAG5409958.1 hypothetical protein IGI04_006277 [Brassica rapa subsp. trilocularis]
MAIHFVFPKSSRKTPPMKGLELQCSPLKPLFKIPTDLPHPTIRLISRCLFISSCLLPQILPLSFSPQIVSSKS